MDTKKIAILALLVVAYLSGCATYDARFMPPLMQDTNVVFKENDFKYIQTNCTGSASAGWILGAFPLEDPRIFSRALANMYSQIQGSLENKPTQLVNWTVDFNNWSILFYSRDTVLFRADLIEYAKQ